MPLSPFLLCIISSFLGIHLSILQSLAISLGLVRLSISQLPILHDRLPAPTPSGCYGDMSIINSEANWNILRQHKNKWEKTVPIPKCWLNQILQYRLYDTFSYLIQWKPWGSNAFHYLTEFFSLLENLLLVCHPNRITIESKPCHVFQSKTVMLTPRFNHYHFSWSVFPFSCFTQEWPVLLPVCTLPTPPPPAVQIYYWQKPSKSSNWLFNIRLSFSGNWCSHLPISVSPPGPRVGICRPPSAGGGISKRQWVNSGRNGTSGLMANAASAPHTPSNSFFHFRAHHLPAVFLTPAANGLLICAQGGLKVHGNGWPSGGPPLTHTLAP